MKSVLRILLISIIFLGATIDNLEAQVLFGTGKMVVRVDNYGAIRIFTLDGPDTTQHLNRVSLLAAGNPNEVMDYWNDLDAEVISEIVVSPTQSDFEVYGVYNNAYSGLPPNFKYSQNVYGWNDQNFCVVKVAITNLEVTQQSALLGLDIVQYMDYTWENDKIFYDVANQQLTQFENHYVGVKILSEFTTSAQIFDWYDGYQNSDSSYFSWLTASSLDTDTLTTTADGGVSILGGESVTLQTDEVRTFYFAIAAGLTHEEMLNNMDLAFGKYEILTAVNDNDNTIKNFVLDQNFPNPFNPSTKISYQIPQSEFVTLKVYNLLGNEIVSLVNQNQPAGRYDVDFNASGLSSGIYFYTIQAGSFTLTKKMILIK